MAEERRRLHEIGARAGRGERREDGPDTAITPTAAPRQGPVDPAMRALETYLEASLDRLLLGSEASPSGLLVLSAWHEAMPALVHLDPVLEAVDSRVFAVLWLWAREQGRSTVAFPSYDYLIKRTNVQARSTVARSLAILRITRWITLCRRVRDRSGRYRGNIYALHEETLSLASSFYLDPGYMAFLQDATRHHHARVRQVAQAMVQSLGECIDEGEDVLATPPLSQADQRIEALSAIRGKGSGNFFGFRHGALSALRSWRWTMEKESQACDAEPGDTHRVQDSNAVEAKILHADRVQNSNSALCSSRYIKKLLQHRIRNRRAKFFTRLSSTRRACPRTNGAWPRCTCEIWKRRSSRRFSTSSARRSARKQKPTARSGTRLGSWPGCARRRGQDSRP